MVEKNTYITATVEGTTVNGEGIVRHDGVTFFVPSCLTGEKVCFLVLKVKDKIGYGKLEEVYTPAEERVREVCPVYSKCGGCCLQHLRYNDQLDLKARYVQDTLKKIGGIEYAVPRTVASDRPYAYRNKLQLPVGVDKNGETAVGFYAQRS
ncbi:MAG: class I SAM-dependent RNA methyltransferase, partial [Clostridia bacterium]|nr:class I SAM-dependent RNA methyltransferase [Clostridia bacterium]